jgi:hypothetical protein
MNARSLSLTATRKFEEILIVEQVSGTCHEVNKNVPRHVEVEQCACFILPPKRCAVKAEVF